MAASMCMELFWIKPQTLILMIRPKLTLICTSGLIACRSTYDIWLAASNKGVCAKWLCILRDVNVIYKPLFYIMGIMGYVNIIISVTKAHQISRKYVWFIYFLTKMPLLKKKIVQICRFYIQASKYHSYGNRHVLQYSSASDHTDTQAMAWNFDFRVLYGAKPLSKPILDYCQLEP